MRILYGVVGEGMGHATRSKVTCEHLVERGHEVKIVVSGRAHGFLAKSFPDVVEIKGLTIRYVDNKMDRDGTLARNLVAAPSIVGENIARYYDEVVGYEPDLVISDFDSFAYLFAKRHGLPIISIDNQQIISRCKHDAAIKKGVKVDYQMTKAFVRAKLPGCDHYVVTTFFYPPIRKKFKDTTTLVPPILRRAILEAKARATVGDHVLVYQTSASDSGLLPALGELRDHRFVVYGLKRHDQPGAKKKPPTAGPTSERVGNCLVKDFSEDGFVHDLATAQAVVCNGGLSLIGEALYLGKPIFSVPVQNQFEQVMNARYLEELGYGLAADALDPQLLRLFLRERDRYAARVARHKQNGNEELFGTVDGLARKLGKKARKRRAREATGRSAG
jgi:uncharacterized protein (TIGR00661 family)